jgi:AcrR family transcriptional regulator
MTTSRQQSAADRRKQILDGALAVFSTRGFSAATNKQIADESGINSPGLIYHYFASKADLLKAVIENNAPILQLLIHSDAIMRMPLEAGLTRIAHTYIKLMSDPKFAAFVRVLVGEAARSAAFAAVLREIAPLRVLKFIETYLQNQIDKGVLAPDLDAAIAAHAFMGSLAVHVMMRIVLQLPDKPGFGIDNIVSTSVGIFLRGTLRREDASDA